MIIRKIKSPIFSAQCVVDNEISNDISDVFNDWHYDKADIICCGILYKDDITIIFREKGDDIEVYKEELLCLLNNYECMFAFNRNMEYGNFRGFLGKEFNICEIKAFNGKSWNKQKFFMELVNDGFAKLEDVPLDPLENDSKDCISCYEKAEYEKIINHNIADLIKQAILLQQKEYLFNKYKCRIDNRGFLNTKI
jgi:hypothetical protein